MHMVRIICMAFAALSVTLAGAAPAQTADWNVFAGPVEHGDALRCAARNAQGILIDRYAVNLPSTHDTYIESVISLPVPEQAVQQFATETTPDNFDRLNVEDSWISAGLGLETDRHLPSAISLAGSGYRVDWFLAAPDPLREPASDGMRLISAKVNQNFIAALAAEGALNISLLDKSGQPALRNILPLGDFAAINGALNDCAVQVDFSEPIESPNA